MELTHPIRCNYVEQQHISHGYNAVGEETMELAHPIRSNYVEQQHISHGYNTVGEKTMAPAHSTGKIMRNNRV